MGYAQALRKLEALPADEKELAADKYVFELLDGKPHCGCAIGKLLTEEQRLEIINRGPNRSGIRRLFSYLRIRDHSDLFGMDLDEARRLQEVNDEAEEQGNDVSARKERYRIVIGWLRGQVAKETP